MEESLGMTKTQYKTLVKYISDNMKVPVLGAGGGFAPLGCINAYMGTVAPQGWLICNGQTVNITDYPELAAHFASQLGSSNVFGGDGTTTFAMPDLRGEFLRGSGTNSHENQGNGGTVGQHQDATEMPYVHSQYNNSSNKGQINFRQANQTSWNAYSKTDSEIGTNRSTISVYSDSQNGTASGVYAVTSRPTNTSVTYIIKATVAGNPNGHNYSTEEQIVGTWVDGSLVYEITVEHTFSTPITKDTPSFAYSILKSDVPSGTHTPNILVSYDVFLTGADNGVTTSAEEVWDCRVWSPATVDTTSFLGIYQDVDSSTARTFTKSIITVRYTARSN